MNEQEIKDLQFETVDRLQRENMRLKMALKETLDAMDLGDYPARYIAFLALSEEKTDE